MYVGLYRRESGGNPNSSTLEPELPQYYLPPACVIAQHYSSATFVSLRFHSHEEKFGAH